MGSVPALSLLCSASQLSMLLADKKTTTPYLLEAALPDISSIGAAN